MMDYSSWSKAESGVTMGVGVGGVGEGGVPDGEYSDGSTSLRRCVPPKVQVTVNGSDQEVPVYWDQTVPVWPSCEQPEDASCKRKVARTSSGIGHGECYPSTYLRLRSFPGDVESSEGTEEDYNGGYESRRSSAAVVEVSGSEVSFDDIMSMYQSSMYQSSLMEKKSQKWTRALRAILKHRSRKRRGARPRRLWRSCAESLNSSATVDIAVQLKCSRFGRRHSSGDVDESLLRTLQESIERTSICDSSSSSSHNSDMGLLPSGHAIFEVRRCDFQDQLQRRRDPLKFTTHMLTTSSS